MWLSHEVALCGDRNTYWNVLIAMLCSLACCGECIDRVKCLCRNMHTGDWSDCSADRYVSGVECFAQTQLHCLRPFRKRKCTMLCQLPV